MIHLGSVLKMGGGKLGLVFGRDQGLDLEIWNTGPKPCWSTVIPIAGPDDRSPAQGVTIPPVSRWLLILPTYLCTSRYLWLPARDPVELADMLEFELPRIVPCNTLSWTWDFSIVGTREDGASRVMVVLSPVSVVEPWMETLRSLDIRPNLVTAGAFFRAMWVCPKDSQEARFTGWMWLDSGSADFFVTQGRRLTFMRGIPIGDHGPRDSGFLDSEIGRSVSMLREQGACPDMFFVGGTGPLVAQAAETLKRISNTTVGPIDSDSLNTPASLFHSVRTGVSRDHGRAGRFDMAHVNLLPRHMKESRLRTSRRRQVIGQGLTICLVVLLLLMCLKASIWRKTHLHQRYQQRLSQIAPLAQKLQFLQDQLNLIQAQIQRNVSMLDIVGELYRVLPQDVTIHNLSMEQGRQVVIRAQAKRLSQAFDCIDPLEQSPYFSNVRQSYANLREIEGSVLIDFELKTDFQKPVTRRRENESTAVSLKQGS